MVNISVPGPVTYFWLQISAVFPQLRGLGTSYSRAYNFLEELEINQMKGAVSAFNISTVQTS